MTRAILPSSWSHSLLGVLRIITALLFMQRGMMKLFGFPPSADHGKVAELVSLMGVAGILECFGGLMLLLGLFTPVVAFVLSGQMAVAYFMANAPQSFYPALNGGEPSILFCFVFLYLAAAGPGRWSLDSTLFRRVRPLDL